MLVVCRIGCITCELSQISDLTVLSQQLPYDFFIIYLCRFSALAIRISQGTVICDDDLLSQWGLVMVCEVLGISRHILTIRRRIAIEPLVGSGSKIKHLYMLWVILK